MTLPMTERGYDEYPNCNGNAGLGRCGVERRVTFGLQSETWAKPLSAVPEPSTYGLLLAGLGVVGWRRSRLRA
jgi:hypothetical protein